MAGKNEGINDGRSEEMEALLNIPGVNPEKIAEQINKGKGVKTDVIKTDPVKTDPIKQTLRPIR